LTLLTQTTNCEQEYPSADQLIYAKGQGRDKGNEIPNADIDL